MNKIQKTIMIGVMISIMPLFTFADTVPTTGGAANTGAVSDAGSSPSSVPTTGGDSSNGAVSQPVAPVTPPGSGGGSSSSGGSFYGGFSSGGFSAVPLAAVAPIATSTSGLSTTSCPLISGLLKFGADNNTAEVINLQLFLKDSEGLDVKANGVFDAATEAAVKAFQLKYLNDTMAPWGATQASGIVYITTAKKINELACASPLTLSPSDLAVIAAYKQNLVQSSASANNGNAGAPVVGPALNGAVGATSTVGSADVGNASDQTANVAAVGNASILGRFWSFLKGIF